MKHFAGIFERSRNGTYAVYIDSVYFGLIYESDLDELRSTFVVTIDGVYREVNIH